MNIEITKQSGLVCKTNVAVLARHVIHAMLKDPFIEIKNQDDEQKALNLLKKEFPKGSKVKIKPFGFNENILLAKVFDINETKEMTELLIAKDLSKKTCRN